MTDIVQFLALLFGTVELWPEIRQMLARAINIGDEAIGILSRAIQHNLGARWRKLLMSLVLVELGVLSAFGILAKAAGADRLPGFTTYWGILVAVGVGVPFLASFALRNVRPVDWSRYLRTREYIADLETWDAWQQLTLAEQQARIAAGVTAPTQPVQPADIIQDMDEFGPNNRMNAWTVAAMYLPPVLVALGQMWILLFASDRLDIPWVYAIPASLMVGVQLLVARLAIHWSLRAVVVLFASLGDGAVALANNLLIRPVLIWAGIGLTEANFAERIKLAMAPFAELREKAALWDRPIAAGIGLLYATAVITQSWVHVLVTACYLIVSGVFLDFALRYVDIDTKDSRKKAMLFVVGLLMLEFIFQCVRTIDWMGRVQNNPDARYATVGWYWGHYVVGPVNGFFHLSLWNTVIVLAIIAAILYGVRKMSDDGWSGRVRTGLTALLGASLLFVAFGHLWARTHHGETPRVSSWGRECATDANCGDGETCHPRTHTCSGTGSSASTGPTVNMVDLLNGRTAPAPTAVTPHTLPVVSPPPPPPPPSRSTARRTRAHASAPVTASDRCAGLRPDFLLLAQREGRCL